jgi:hypothetical protein
MVERGIEYLVQKLECLLDMLRSGFLLVLASA